MMSNYLIKPFITLVHDQEDLAVDALVASGDCFVTLATQLDAVNQQLEGQPGHEVLEAVTSVLLDLQRRYRVVAKTGDYGHP